MGLRVIEGVSDVAVKTKPREASLRLVKMMLPQMYPSAWNKDPSAPTIDIP